MPTYEYLCSACKNEWEEIQKISENAIEVCPKCGQSTAQRQISAGNFILKGGGWYADLYSSTPKKGGESKSESTSSSVKADAPAAKSDTSATASTSASPASTSSAPSTTAGPSK